MDALPLSMPVVLELFDRLMRVYGTRFTNTYAGQDPFKVRTAWAHELRGLEQPAIDYALDHLPADYVPNVLQFRSLAQAAPRPQEPRVELPAVQANTDGVRALLAALQTRQRASPVQVWQAVLANPRSTLTAREMAQAALQRLGAA